MTRQKMAACVGVVAACLFSSAVAADPFPWEDAEITTNVLKLAGTDEATYRVGHIWQGERVEVSIVLDRGAPGRDDQDLELLHEMTDEPPRLSTRCDTLIAEWSTFPMGADTETIEKRCWKIDAPGQALTSTDCS